MKLGRVFQPQVSNALIALVFGIFVCLYSPKSEAALAESTATVSWSSAIPSNELVFQSYAVGEDLDSPDDQSSFILMPPTNATPQSLTLTTPPNQASVLANATTLTVQSEANDGSIGSSAQFSDFYFFAGLPPGMIEISVPYTLSALSGVTTGLTTVSVVARFEKFDDTNVSTGPAVTVSNGLEVTGIGTPNDVTGMLSLQVPFNSATDFSAVLDIFVFSESSATPVESVPIPGGLALALPALLPFFASCKKRPRNDSEKITSVS